MTAMLYAIADCDRASAPTRTRGGRALKAVGNRSPLAILAERAEPSVEALWDYDRTLAELMDKHAVLPARYGTVVDEERAAGMLYERREEFVEALERVRGADELSVTSRLDAAETDPQSGKDYLLRRLKAGRLAALDAHARASTTLPATDRARRAYLVDRAQREAFLDAVRRLDEQCPELELVCTGPWPPYSFCGGWS
jgi:hypothetical protein